MTISVNEQDRSAFSYHVFVNIEYKFIFFTIPKVACTPWIQLFLRMSGIQDWRSNPHHDPNRPFLSKLDHKTIELYLNDPGWTKAVFFRDPLERLLSAYLNKIEQGSYITRRLFKAGGGEITFPTFVEIVTDNNQDITSPRGLHDQTDPHWKPQYLIANIEKFISAMDFIGDFSELQSDTRTLLEKIGVWDKFGSSGWADTGNDEMFAVNKAHNQTAAQEKLNEYYVDNLAEEVKKAYAKDYDFLAQHGLHYSA